MSTATLPLTFADRLQVFRQRAGLTQTELADRAGVPVGSLRAWEQAVRAPGALAFVRLLQALGVSADEFVDADR
jgi:transcriptional regulator with XRE-family HTH domain